MATRVGSNTPWVAPLEARRAELTPPPESKARAPEVIEGRPSAVGAVEPLPVPAKLLEAYGPAIRAAGGELQRLAGIAKALEPHEKKPFALAEKKLHGLLAAELARAGDSAPRIARALAQSLATVAEGVGPGPHVVPAMYAVLGLLDAGARLAAKGALARTPAEVASGADAAARVVLDLAARLRGKEGVSSALHVFTNLVESLAVGRAKAVPDGAAALGEAEWRASWTAVSRFLEEAAPRRGFSTAVVAGLAEEVSLALRDGEDRALTRAKVKVHAALEPERAAALDALRGPGEIDRALAALVTASPAGPAELYVAARTLGEAARGVDPAIHRDLSRLIGALASEPYAAEALARLTAILPRLDGRALTKAAAQGRERLASNLLRLELAARGADAGPYGEALSKLDALPAELRLGVAVAASAGEGLDPARLQRMVHLARTVRTDTPLTDLLRFSERHAVLTELLAERPALAPEAGALAAEIARLSTESLPAAYGALLDGLEALKRLAADVPLASLLASKDGRPGLVALADPASDYRNPPLALLPRLLGGAVEGEGIPAAAPRSTRPDGEVVRAALEVAAGLGRVGKDPSAYLERVATDFAAAARAPETLRRRAESESGVSVRAAKFGLLDALHAVKGLPAEAALTAALHLTRDQRTWVGQVIARSPRDLSAARAMRDFVLGAVQAGRLDVLEAARASTAAPKAVRRAIDRVAEGFRLGALTGVPFDVLATGLRAGRDAVADLDKARDAREIEGVDLQALTGGKVTPEGRAALLGAAANLSYYLGLYVPGGATFDQDIDMASLRPVLLGAIKSAAEGTWPTPKYENAVGQRQMAELSPAQQAIWRQTLVTPAAPEPDVQDPKIQGAMVLLRGLHAAMPEHIPLRGLPDIPLGFDAASIEQLHAARDLALADLRGSTKGTPEHRAAAEKLGHLRDDLAVLELWRAVDQSLDHAPKDVMLRVRPALEAARGVLVARGGQGFAEAIDEVLFATQDLRASAREGRHAADEDSIAALTTSNTSGCLGPHWPGGPGRQWGIAGALADPNVRMLRVFEGDRQVYRGFMKFFHGELPGYSGPVMYLDAPQPDGGGGDSDLTLWYRHAVQKATAMGIPVATGLASIAGGHTPERLAEVGRSLGLEVRDKASIHFSVDEGNTGYMHSDTMFSGKGNIRVSRGDKPTWDFALDTVVVMP